MTLRLRLAALLGLCALAACGGEDNSTTAQTCPTGQLPNSGCTSSTNAVDPGGFWSGNDPITGLELQGLILENGDLRFDRADGSQYVGSVSTNSTGQFSGNIDGYAAYGSTLPDGSIHGTGTVSGTITPNSSMTVTINFTTDGGTASSGTGTLAFESIYDQPVPVASLAGSYTVSQHTGFFVTLNSEGSASSNVDPATGCSFTGTLSQVDSSYNAYDATVVFTGCTGTSAPLNGIQLTGLSVVTATTNPYQFATLLTGDIGGATRAVSYLAMEK